LLKKKDGRASGGGFEEGRGEKGCVAKQSVSWPKTNLKENTDGIQDPVPLDFLWLAFWVGGDKSCARKAAFSNLLCEAQGH